MKHCNLCHDDPCTCGLQYRDWPADELRRFAMMILDELSAKDEYVRSNLDALRARIMPAKAVYLAIEIWKREKRMIPAIKELRKKTGLGLQEAKDFFDELRDNWDDEQNALAV